MMYVGGGACMCEGHGVGEGCHVAEGELDVCRGGGT